MRILDRYIFKSIVLIFLTTIFIFSFLYIIIDMASNLDDFIERKVPLLILVRYYLIFLPIIFVQTSFIACLISTLLTFSQLNNNNEVIALRMSGLNFWQITKPALCFAIFVSTLAFGVNEKFVPQADIKSRNIRWEHIVVDLSQDKKTRPVIKNLTLYGWKNRLYFIDTFDPNTSKMEGITIIEFNEEQNVTEKIIAHRGEWAEPAWKLYNCQISSINPNDITNTIKVKVYDEKYIEIKETPEDFIRQRLHVTSMNIRELHEYISRFASSGANKAVNNLRIDLFEKIAFPFGNIVIILTGLPFALMLRRRKALTFTSLGIAIAIGFLYYVFNAVGLALGKGGLFPPMIAASCTPFLFSVVALGLIKTRF